MNFLAHLFLSCEDEELLIGNFIGDFVRSRDDAQYSAGIQRGLKLHRKIDSFTDTHPAVLESVRLLRPYHRKYAPVVLDVFYDFLLAKNWTQFSVQSLKKYTQNIYKILESNIHLMPPVLQHRLPLMIADDWLVRYGEWDGLAFTFSRMKLRASKPGHFDNVIEHLQAHLEPLDKGFQRFFPEAIQYVRNSEYHSELP
ncbi:MAG: ACP phosphodiesterase [Saprospiraceae bacterium]|nr:ACP phosphodiesterase [Saprospiraceae bacterium]